MALIKKTNWKGFDADYWTIIRRMEDKLQNNTHVELALFKDKATYEAEKHTLQWGSLLLTTRSVVVEGIDHSREELYNRVKEPSPRFEYVQDPVTYETLRQQHETNFFADAEDDL